MTNGIPKYKAILAMHEVKLKGDFRQSGILPDPENEDRASACCLNMGSKGWPAKTRQVVDGSKISDQMRIAKMLAFLPPVNLFGSRSISRSVRNIPK